MGAVDRDFGEANPRTGDRHKKSRNERYHDMISGKSAEIVAAKAEATKAKPEVAEATAEAGLCFGVSGLKPTSPTRREPPQLKLKTQDLNLQSTT